MNPMHPWLEIILDWCDALVYLTNPLHADLL